MRMVLTAMLCGGLALVCASSANAEVLITEAEAKLPNSPDAAMTMRGLTRGPAIEQVEPSADSKSPLKLKIKFVTRNNVDIDVSSVKLTYLKVPVVDLTARIKQYVKSSGIEMDAAEVPLGQHTMRLDVKDKQGRASSAFLKVRVAPK